MSLFTELKRRNVLRAGAAYVVTSWLIIQVVETIFPAFGFGDMAIRWVVIVLAIGFLPAMVLAWAFDLTPHGLTRDRDIDRNAPETIRSGRMLDRAIMAVLALALAFFAYDKFIIDPAEDRAIAEEAREIGRSESLAEAMADSFDHRSIAVLAFADMSPDGDQEYLSDGIAEEILNLLTRAAPELRVTPRSSAFSFKGKDMGLSAIAEQLRVAHVLEGSVRKDGNRVRISAQLSDTQDNSQLWSQSWDRTLDDIFAIQDEVAAAVVNELKLQLFEDQTARRVDPDAYFLFLEGKHAALKSSQKEVAIPFFEQALAIQPDYQEAWLGLSRTWWALSHHWEISEEERQQLLAKSDETFNRAKQIDPDHPVILAWLAFEAMNHRTDYEAAARMFEQAISRDPYHWDILRPAAALAYILGRFDLSRKLGQFMLDRDPLCDGCYYTISKSYRLAGDFEKAEKYQRLLMDRNPDAGILHHHVATLLFQEKFQEAEKVIADVPDEVFRSYLDLLLRIVRRDPGVQSGIDFWVTEHASNKEEQAAQLYAMNGNFDRAFEWLEKVADRLGKYDVAHAMRNPLLWPLHDDDRWQEWLEFAGISDDQLAQIDYDIELPD